MNTNKAINYSEFQLFFLMLQQHLFPESLDLGPEFEFIIIKTNFFSIIKAETIYFTMANFPL